LEASSTDGALSLVFPQEKLALIAEIERSHVGRVERGDNNVTVLVLVKLAKSTEHVC
jgi:transcriptional regulator with XRE-family HTH domain